MKLNLIWEDLIAIKRKNNFFSFFKAFMLVPGFRVIFIYRISNYLYKKKLRILSQILFNINHLLHGCEIKASAKIGKGIQIPHAVGIVIGEGVIIGEYCMIYQNVTLGTNSYTAANYPEIGNNVCLYTGVTVIGNVKIGEKSRIGANSLVINDIPNASIAVGSPAKVIKEIQE
ncbi:serine O-acetyltransferase [Niallia taxi]|uniref:serine O-acetyltransferase EpsC n=1 Tax=Niallia taxi TaxID=2499688 RepID=UPI0011A9BE70|nr:serine O-acetyltransferase EpsC [Niallia taxi]WOD63558.1 serine O-acetyltransferase [Niallia taxi]